MAMVTDSGLLLSDLMSLGTDHLYGQAHQVHGSYSMLETGMHWLPGRRNG